MSTDYPYSLAQLAQILSALENERRNPNTKRNAIRAIERAAAAINLTTGDLFAAADGLLSGRVDAADWRAGLGSGDACGHVLAEAVADDGVPGADQGPAEIAPSARARRRANSKQARVIAMLRRPEGATIQQIMDETGWLAHTVRGALSGTIGKKLGLTVTSSGTHGRRLYRIED